ncbi:precorrin-3B C(17)-methyltransferase [Oscillatoria sp. FACHB-1406]|uniref:precorrin-3B C(17)-methyltransferase n=1 Tax=Oscillatoria sp. FACHB-1406 TaxID=2692846 RepID=UPI0016855B92|nr:precorrin-3B C(17)-methyltransferase [Oscillatoria sp. FACHB-1406]MBD2579875.1 precorrin-3B C(17)-methyltransferase [Oscillatoria sp. FACHB-1406]
MFNSYQDFQPIAAIATTPDAAVTLQRFCQESGASLWLPERLQGDRVPEANFYSGSLKDCIATLWGNQRALVFGMAAGAVVRLIAPLLRDKATDPAVVVLDPMGKFAVSLCGGHQGGGDRLAELIARQLGATTVITGAAASLGLPGVDVLGVPFGWRKGEGDWTAVSAAIARGEQVTVFQQAGSRLWESAIENSPFTSEALGGCELHITPYKVITSSDKAVWHPRVLWVGLGCERGTSRELMEVAIARVFEAHQLAEDAIAGIATLDLKADETGLLELCDRRNWALKTFTAEELRAVTTPNPSAIVEREVGTPSVAEAAALLISQQNALLAPKQVFSAKNEVNPGTGAVTVAVALSKREYIGRTGQLWLVGTGPGGLEQMTPAAQTAIASSDAIIGYSLYLDLIQPLHHPGQIFESFPITQERERAQRAIELAEWGLSVAVVSSGDCGIYGMAGLVFEELQARGWDGKTPQVQVLPGITALQAAASRVGAPLMHDFCAISLSDLLTPWDVIEKRLEAAARADFVTALYNPRSQKRTQQIVTARDIFLKYRDRKTPVAIVRSAYRPDEEIFQTTLAEMLDVPIDMLTTVIIGNSTTRFYNNWTITPRGYYK